MKNLILLLAVGVIALACVAATPGQIGPVQAPGARKLAGGNANFWDGKESIEDYAKRLNLKPTETFDLGGGVKLDMVLVPAGKFLMGSPANEKYRESGETQHEVTITKPYYMGKYHVTQRQWSKVMPKNPSYQHVPHDSEYPIDCVTWDAANDFCKKLSELTHRTFRLPTEAEWERACRAGTQTMYYNGNDESKLSEICQNDMHPHEVGRLKPNNWGMYDMHGLVWQWCSDWQSVDYGSAPQTDPQGCSQKDSRYGMMKVCRGSSYEDGNGKVPRDAFRGALQIGHDGDWFFGMRVAMDAPK